MATFASIFCLLLELSWGCFLCLVWNRAGGHRLQHRSHSALVHGDMLGFGSLTGLLLPGLALGFGALAFGVSAVACGRSGFDSQHCFLIPPSWQRMGELYRQHCLPLQWAPFPAPVFYSLRCAKAACEMVQSEGWSLEL